MIWNKISLLMEKVETLEKKVDRLIDENHELTKECWTLKRNEKIVTSIVFGREIPQNTWDWEYKQIPSGDKENNLYSRLYKIENMFRLLEQEWKTDRDIKREQYYQNLNKEIQQEIPKVVEKALINGINKLDIVKIAEVMIKNGELDTEKWLGVKEDEIEIVKKDEKEVEKENE